jgi:hypothetical protein
MSGREGRSWLGLSLLGCRAGKGLWLDASLIFTLLRREK